MAAFTRSIDTILWGRKTFDQSLERDPSGGEFSSGMFGTGVTHYLFSRTPRTDLPPSVFQVDGPIGEFARELRSRAGRDIWMMGGASLIASFLDAGEIDAFVIHVIPTLIGAGIPLIEPKNRTVELKLVSTRKFVDGVVRLSYDVIR
jgi:dihydrofolate reductase